MLKKITSSNNAYVTMTMTQPQKKNNCNKIKNILLLNMIVIEKLIINKQPLYKNGYCLSKSYCHVSSFTIYD
jgi:hypothetical protein